MVVKREMTDNSRAVAQAMSQQPVQPPEEEIIAATPSVLKQAGEYDLEDVKQLASKLAQLGNGHALLRRRKMNTVEINAIRHQLELLGFRLIMRTRPGETYFWRGEALETKQAEATNIIHTKLARPNGRRRR